MHIVNYDNPPPIDELRLSNLTDAKMDNGRYTWEKKYQTVVLFMATGHMRDTAEKAGVSYATLEKWRKMPWWDQMVLEIKEAESTQLNTKLNKIINKALSVVEDRLDNGELGYAKDGTSFRKEVGIKDAIRASTELLQRKINLEKNSVENVVRQATVQETLKALAAEFAKMSAPKNVVELQEVEDAVYEERKA